MLLLLGRYNKKVLYFYSPNSYGEIEYSMNSATLGSKTIEVYALISRSRDDQVNDLVSLSPRILILQHRSRGIQVFWTYEDGTTTYTNTLGVFPRKWRTYALVYDEDQLEIRYYNNGKIVGSFDLQKPISGNVEKIYIAYSDSGLDHYYNGYIAIVRIYDRALSDLEIKHNYINAINLRPTNIRDGLLVELIPDTLDCNNGVWHDNSGNGNDAVLNTGRCIEI